MELRLYSFVNFYLSPMQKGIQTGHAAVDLMLKYSGRVGNDNSDFQKTMVYDWAKDHKTFIVLDGGNSKSLTQSTDIIFDAGFPFETFCEDKDSLERLHTCTVVILPEYIFGAKLASDGMNYIFQDAFKVEPAIVTGPGDATYNIIKLVTSSRLAS
jgi:hypothetical protein